MSKIKTFLVSIFLMFPFFAAVGGEQLGSVQVNFPTFSCLVSPVSLPINVPQTVKLKGYRAVAKTTGPTQVAFRLTDGNGNVLTANVLNVSDLATDELFYQGDFFLLSKDSVVTAEAFCVDDEVEVDFRLVGYFSR